jgi:hypothetical protein
VSWQADDAAALLHTSLGAWGDIITANNKGLRRGRAVPFGQLSLTSRAAKNILRFELHHGLLTMVNPPFVYPSTAKQRIGFGQWTC